MFQNPVSPVSIYHLLLLGKNRKLWKFLLKQANTLISFNFVKQRRLFTRSEFLDILGICFVFVAYTILVCMYTSTSKLWHAAMIAHCFVYLDPCMPAAAARTNFSIQFQEEQSLMDTRT